jgi:hypothetical protein
LVGECKWTENENAARLIYELGQKVSKLTFTKDKTIILCLFLKKRPKEKIEHQIYLLEDVIELLG